MWGIGHTGFIGSGWAWKASNRAAGQPVEKGRRADAGKRRGGGFGTSGDGEAHRSASPNYGHLGIPEPTPTLGPYQEQAGDPVPILPKSSHGERWL